MNTTRSLTPVRVEAIFNECLARRDEPTAEPVLGVVISAKFHQARLNEFRAEIEQLLLELPVQFFEPNGASFLMASTTHSGELWTGDHQIVDQLVILGLAIGKVQFTIPREFWEVTDPYFTISI